MALTSTLPGAVRFALSLADRGRVMALRAAVAVASAMSAIEKHCSDQRSRAFSGPQTQALAAAIEVEILLVSWRARHRPPEQEGSGRFCLCCDRRIPSTFRN
jgi:hypothetical protein